MSHPADDFFGYQPDDSDTDYLDDTVEPGAWLPAPVDPAEETESKSQDDGEILF